MSLRPAWPIALLGVFILACWGCSTATPSPPAADGAHAADPLVAARAISMQDARISKLLAPLANGTLEASSRGFDARFDSPGLRLKDTTAIGLHMPQTASQPMRVGAGNDPALALTLMPKASATAPAGVATSNVTPTPNLRDGVVTYPDAFTDTDMLAAAGRSSAEILYLLKSPAAPKRFLWTVELPSGVAKVESRNDGVWFLDAHGDLVVHVPEPYAIDANGKKQIASLSWNRSTRELAVELIRDAELTYPVLLDPAFETAVWSELQTPPPASRAQFVYDEKRQRNVLFGGGVPRSQTWLFDGTSWLARRFVEGDVLVPEGAVGVWDPVRERTVAVGTNFTAVFDGIRWSRVAGAQPPPRRGHTVAWDAVRKQIVVFGGNDDAGAPLQDTWVYDGTKWSEVTGAAPPARTGHALTWDDERKVLVLFGGATATSTWLTDTWVFDGAWRIVDVAQAPQGRRGHSVAWDYVRKNLVLFGGDSQTRTAFSDTWTFDGTSWRPILVSSPPIRFESSMVWDKQRSALVLFAGGTHSADPLGDSWIFDGDKWEQIAVGEKPPFREGQAAVWDGARQHITVFGGNNSSTTLGDTWVLDAAGWRSVALASPAPRTGQRTAWDAKRNRLVLFGGATRTFNAGTVYGDTWIFDGVTWRQVSGTPAPPPCTYYHKLAWHPNSGDTVMFGGLGCFGETTWVLGDATWRAVVPSTGTWPETRWAHALAPEYASGNVIMQGGYGYYVSKTFDDTWVFDGTAWQQAMGTSPGRLANAQFVFWDAKRKKTILFGGRSETNAVTSDVWEFDGTGWTRRAMAGNVPPGRSAFAMSWDAARETFVLFGGDSATRTVLSDTWQLDGNQWIRTQGQTPPPRTGGKAPNESLLSWDADRKQTVLFGGSGPDGVLGDTWAFDGSQWASAVDLTQVSPPPRADGTFIYDPMRHRHILFGGLGINGVLGDTWFLYLRGGGCTSGVQCGSGYCTDGVCCEAQTCGTCSTCNGLSPGKCTVLANAEDADTCAYKDKKSCDAVGQCIPSLGAACTKPSDCATGFCAGGVCCDTACDRACEACGAKDKLTGRDDGRCGPSIAGSNPGNRCVDGATCGATGTCDRGGACKDDRTAVDVKGNASDCGDYRCASGVCGKSCVSLNDCNAPAVCTQDFKCTRITNSDELPGACCATTPGKSGAGGDAAGLAGAALGIALVRLRRKHRK